MRLNSKKLLITTFLYIYIPVAIFLIGFTAPLVWIITLGACGYFGYRMYKDYGDNLGDDITISWPIFAVAVAVIVLMCILIGFGGVFNQTGDWYKHNAVLHDLINKSWPVYYTAYEESMLTYYLGQYLVPAMIGKLAGSIINTDVDIAFNVAECAMALWGMFGVVLVYLNLTRLTHSDTIRKQIRLLWILFFFCGALPVAQIVSQGIFGENMYSLGAQHWLLANGLMLQYRSNLVMLRWVYPQVIVTWLIVILFMENKKKIEHYVLLLVPIVLYGTFSIVVMSLLALGYAIFELVTANDKKYIIKSIFSISNIVTALTLGIVLVSYFWGYIQVEKPDYMSFKMIDIDASKIATILIFDLFMFGIYSICVYPRQKKSFIFYGVNLLLAVIPFFTMGIFNDWVMGTSISGLFIILIFVVDMLNANDSLAKDDVDVRKYTVLSVIIIITLLIGSWYPLMEVKENIVAYVPGDNTWDAFGTLEYYSDRSSEESADMIYNYYTYDLQGKFFYEHLAARKLNDNSTSTGILKKKYSVQGIYFDTFISISSYDDTSEDVIDEALNMCDKYSKIFSKTDADSEVYRINNRENNLADIGSGIYKTEISDDLKNVLETGIEYGDLTGGRFNIAMGTVTSLWDFQSGNGTVPDESSIDEALEHIDISSISIDGNMLTITDSKLQLDLGGIAKGYIANRLRDYFLDNGSTNILIALGGNIVCIGDKGNSGYTVGIQKPYGSQGEALTSIEVADTSVVSSGVYERYFEQDGIKYHHILNPVTGYSANTDIDGVTVICKDSMKADILSTTLLMMGREYAMEYLEGVNNSISGEPVTKVIFVSDSGKITYWDCNDEEE